MMLSYGTLDQIPIKVGENAEEERKNKDALPVFSLLGNGLVDESFCRDMMARCNMSEYDIITKEKYLKTMVPDEHKLLYADEFDRVVAAQYVIDSETKN